MSGLPSHLYSQLRQTLLDCGPFGSNNVIWSIFAHPKLRPFRSQLPEANGRAQRVEVILAYLIEKYRAEPRENALVIFLDVLCEKLDAENECHGQLEVLARTLEAHLTPWLATQATNLQTQDKPQPGSSTTVESAKFQHGYALIVGVGADLPVTIDDAKGLYDIFVDDIRCGYLPQHITLLTGNRATRQRILQGLDRLISLVKNDSQATAVIYFSGHGGLFPEYHLVPYGYRAANLAETAISGSEFTNKLRQIRAQRLLVLLDCCHAGGLAETKAPAFAKSPLPPELDQILGQGTGRVVIASSRKDEKSYTGQPYSVFTQALREALAGYGAAERDGYAYVADLAMYIGRVVPQRTQSRQHPILKMTAADNFAVAYYAAGDKSPKPLMATETYPLPIDTIEADLADGYRNVLKTYQLNLLKVEAQIAQFIDQRTVPLDIIRTKEGILTQIEQIESQIVQKATQTGWVVPFGSTQVSQSTAEEAKTPMSSASSDIFASYERGLQRLNSNIPVDHQSHSDFLVYEQRLRENITQARRYGDNEESRADRAIIIEQLNQLTLANLSISFNELSRSSEQEWSDAHHSPQPAAPDRGGRSSSTISKFPPLAEVRKQLNRLLSDSELDELCLDYFPRMYDRFSRGLQKNEKITLLLDHCRRDPEQFQKLLELLEESK